MFVGSRPTAEGPMRSSVEEHRQPGAGDVKDVDEPASQARLTVQRDWMITRSSREHLIVKAGNGNPERRSCHFLLAYDHPDSGTQVHTMLAPEDGKDSGIIHFAAQHRYGETNRSRTSTSPSGESILTTDPRQGSS
ncbi:hypothetical protein QFC21_007138 [Naganishia friedmannii]|uniref:Uncharacterized protein n=1 Tax=Naganishia friedmannii TaxID=89922 RepID=A0ACC2UXT1_9TREE|nr:hypothetical protein QFC21_007138 [Naganishia friedmannii]